MKMMYINGSSVIHLGAKYAKLIIKKKKNKFNEDIKTNTLTVVKIEVKWALISVQSNFEDVHIVYAHMEARKKTISLILLYIVQHYSYLRERKFYILI